MQTQVTSANSSSTSFEARFARWVIDYRWWILPLSIVLVAALASGGRLLQFSADYRIFFQEDNPERLAYEALERTFSKTNNFSFLIAPHNGNVFTPETLAVVVALTEQGWLLPFATRVDSISNYQHTEAEGDDLIVQDLVLDPTSLSTIQTERIRSIALHEPLLVRRLISEPGHVAAVNVRLTVSDEEKSIQIPVAYAAAKELRDRFRVLYPKIDFYLTGGAVLDATFGEAAELDAAGLLPLSFGLMILILMLLLRSVTATVATLLVTVFSILAAMGLRGYSGFPLSPQSGATPIIILTVAVASCVHLLVTFIHGLQRGEARRAALEESLRINLQPITVASITTALGFLTLNASSVPPSRWMGNTVACGVLVSLFLSLTFLPALLSVLPIHPRGTGEVSDNAMRRLGLFVVAKRKGLFFGMGALIVTLIAFVPLNEANEDPYDWFDQTFEFRRAVDFAEANLTGPEVIDYSLASGEAGGISNPGFLNEADAFAAWLRAQPEIVHVNVLTDTMKRLNMNMHGDDSAWYRLPEARDLNAQYLLLYEMSLPYGLDLNDQIDITKSTIRVTLTMQRLTLQQMMALEARVQAWFEDNSTAIDPSPATGVFYMFAKNNIRNTISMMQATTLALVMISLLLVMAFRSVKLGIASLVPNLVPAAMGFGVWGIIDGWVSMDIAPVMGMTLGIVVDDTVHFMSKYLRARREGNLATHDAVVYAFTTVGQALIITTIVLSVGFLTLSLSHFGLNSRMAGLTCIVIALALAADFLFLPPLLMMIDKHKTTNADHVAAPNHT